MTAGYLPADCVTAGGAPSRLHLPSAPPVPGGLGRICGRILRRICGRICGRIGGRILGRRCLRDGVRSAAWPVVGTALQPGPWSVLLCSVLISRIEIGLAAGRLCLGMQGGWLAVEV